ncbi:uncharacterized protein PHACADRAFT_28085 [Phanerochaete carnosa HHB-10118-sp]|uniref:Uncharacterized protein n=1 Tax=Phanerochaete carnosa (strain HHB-10118-sp) TaxID=650164 RepID=K5WWZ5_PHACS|nr:uncharacterized protein PHACADRAFT_28085 [Phanerochaete carnosa HHB-10118-sp]EKM54997.1 hypothetical protein PHACADRAFT_28085 [Phanerochaete carnosa HHB-10118-sp]
MNLLATKDVEHAAWTNIQPRIEKHMEHIRQLRLAFEQHDPGKATLPLPGELLRRPEIVAIVVQPSEVKVDREAFDPFRELLPDWTQRWREECEAQLHAIVLGSLEYKDKLSANVDPLSLASVAFDCKSCQSYAENDNLLPPLPPHMIAHGCLTGPCSMWNGKDPVERVICAATLYPPGVTIVGYRSWSAKSLRIGVWHRRACEVIRAVGKNPMTTTREEMDALEVRFWCKTCLEDGYEEEQWQVMKWWDALYHYVYHDLVNDLVKPVDYAALPASRKLMHAHWEVMSGEIVSSIKAIKSLASKVYFNRSFKTHPDAIWYFCSHCHVGWENCLDIEEHLYTK